MTYKRHRGERHAVIVGGAGGLGRAAVEQHLARGWRVTATMRSPAPSDMIQSDALKVLTLDTIDWPSIDAVGRTISAPVHRLFLIAGVSGPSDVTIGDADPGAFSSMMLVNTLAPLRIIDRWDRNVAEDATIAVMSSSQASITLNDDATKEAYRISKAGLNMGLRSIAARRDDARTYIAINPGWVRTDIGGSDATISPDESMACVVDTLDRHDGRRGITFVDYRDRSLPW